MKPEEDIQVKNYHDFDANSDIPMPSCKNQSRTGEQGEIKKLKHRTSNLSFAC